MSLGNDRRHILNFKMKSQESYVPRSAMVNLSVNVFGENLNLLEVGGRVEGLENTIEGMFGPEGHFKEDTLQKIFRSVSRQIQFHVQRVR